MGKKPRKSGTNNKRVTVSKRPRWLVPTAIAFGIAVLSGISCAVATVWLAGTKPKAAERKAASEVLARAERQGAIQKIDEVLKQHHGKAEVEGDTLVIEGELPSVESVQAVLNLVKVGLEADVLDVVTPSSALNPELVELKAFPPEKENRDRKAGTRAATVFNRIRVVEN